MRISFLRPLWAGHYLAAPFQDRRHDEDAALLSPKNVLTGRDYANTSAAGSTAGNYSMYDKLPGLWFETCSEEGKPPCTGYCRPNDAACLEVGKRVVSSCNQVWSTYNGHRHNTDNPASGWSTVYTTYGKSAGLSTETVQVYTSFSTANTSIVKQNADPTAGGVVTITPVYALGVPITSLVVKTVTGWSETASWLTAPLPSCRYIALSTSNNCGKCSIYGGTVDLYFWPPATATSFHSGPAAPTPTEPMSTILPDGITLYSPTVYISLTTVYAKDSCSFVGQNHTSTLIAMNPADVSTQIHVGGKAPAYTYGQVNYADLTGLPPVSEYEDQPSCIMFGCPTIYPTFSPTLVVPTALRSLRADWNACESALEGLYDPPIILTAQTKADSITRPAPITTSSDHKTSLPPVITNPASQCSTPAAPTPTPTATSKSAVPPIESPPGLGHGISSIFLIPQPSSIGLPPTPVYTNALGPLQDALEPDHNEHASQAMYTSRSTAIEGELPVSNRPEALEVSSPVSSSSMGTIALGASTLPKPTDNIREHTSQAGPTSRIKAVEGQLPIPNTPEVVDPSSSVSSTPVGTTVLAAGTLPKSTGNILEHQTEPFISRITIENSMVDEQTSAAKVPVTLISAADSETIFMATSSGVAQIQPGTTRMAISSMFTSSSRSRTGLPVVIDGSGNTADDGNTSSVGSEVASKSDPVSPSTGSTTLASSTGIIYEYFPTSADSGNATRSRSVTQSGISPSEDTGTTVTAPTTSQTADESGCIRGAAVGLHLFAFGLLLSLLR